VFAQRASHQRRSVAAVRGAEGEDTQPTVVAWAEQAVDAVRVTQRLCIDCAWARQHSVPTSVSDTTSFVCTHTTALQRISNRLVTGDSSLAIFHSCAIQRAYECGPGGKYWEAATVTINGEVIRPAIAALQGPEPDVYPNGFVAALRRAFFRK